jgi:hypothetical protein
LAGVSKTFQFVTFGELRHRCLFRSVSCPSCSASCLMRSVRSWVSVDVQIGSIGPCDALQRQAGGSHPQPQGV